MKVSVQELLISWLSNKPINKVRKTRDTGATKTEEPSSFTTMTAATITATSEKT